MLAERMAIQARSTIPAGVEEQLRSAEAQESRSQTTSYTRAGDRIRPMVLEVGIPVPQSLSTRTERPRVHPRRFTRLRGRSVNKSEQMARVRSRDTTPERMLRRLLSNHGVRYRLHRKDLPGTPDVYVSRLRLAIFVNGCFWHGHDCARGRRPATNVEFWNTKIERNRARDAEVLQNLATRGIETLTIWQCDIKKCDGSAADIAARYRHAAKRLGSSR
jgi:DNA mismatch endonuclease (patch repair protein)